MLKHVNPLLKILFFISQFFFIFFFRNDLLTLSVIIILALCVLLAPENLSIIISTLLRITPLLLSIFLMGYLFGNTLQKDLMIIFHICIITCYTIVLVHSTSAVTLLSALNKIPSNRIRYSITVFVYGIIRFLPELQHEFSHTVQLYHYHIMRKLRLNDLAILSPLIINRSLKKIHTYSHCAERICTLNHPIRFRVSDIFLVIILLIQVGFILI